MPSPTVKYHETSPMQQHHVMQNNIMEHRNNYNICHQRDNRYEYEIDDNSGQHQPQYQYYNPAQIQHQTINETQQQADQHTIELRMNNLGNENIG
jgi:hypothetical protein